MWILGLKGLMDVFKLVANSFSERKISGLWWKVGIITSQVLRVFLTF